MSAEERDITRAGLGAVIGAIGLAFGVLGQERVIPGEGGRMGYAAETLFAALS